MSGNGPNPVPQMGQPEFLQALFNQLPSGGAWQRNPNSTQGRVFSAVADTLAQMNAVCTRLTEVESDPRKTDLLLSRWESVYGLPDPCAQPGQTVAQRRAALLGRIIALGGSSRPYFVGVAAGYGYTVTIDEFEASCAGDLCAGDALLGPPWDFTWQVNVSGAQDANSAVLECALNRIKPAHTNLIFSYGG